MNRSFDARAWLVWLLVFAVLTLQTRNPLYLIILLLVARLVDKTCAQPGTGIRLPLWRFTLLILTFSTLFNMLMAHIGQTVLFSLPASWPLIGGNITLEAAVYGAINGLILLTLLVAFLAFNAIVPTSDLVRLTPRAFHSVGLVVLVALTYVPETTRQLQRIREAQAIRGHRLRGLRDWQPVALPLLIGGLERAMNLAESMVARGYGTTTSTAQTRLNQVGLLVGLLTAFSGWILAYWLGWPGWLLMGLSAILVIVMLWQLGRGTPHTQYRPRRWQRWDMLLVITAVLPFALFLLPIHDIAQATLSYVPYPVLTLPGFDPILGLSLLFLATPALLIEFGETEGISSKR